MVVDDHLLVRVKKGDSWRYYQPLGEDPAKMVEKFRIRKG
jgi:hypothetical protein